MVGDTFETDILGANRAGITAVFVESGNPPDETSDAVPDLSLPRLAALRELLGL